MIIHMFEKLELRPSFALGGEFSGTNSFGGYNNGKYFIAEADESDGTLVKYQPDIAVINNIDHDHMDFFKSFESIKSTFKTLFNRFIQD